MSSPLRVSRGAGETFRRYNEELPPRRLVELGAEPSNCEPTLPSTSSITAENICDEGSWLETRVEEPNALQLERVSSTEEAKYPELQFSRFKNKNIAVN